MTKGGPSACAATGLGTCGGTALASAISPGFLTASTTAEQVVEEGTQTKTPLRPALIGQCLEVEVMVQVRAIPCILDTGSKVTFFSQTFQRYLHQEEGYAAEMILWLSLNAANGLKLSYVGYAMLDFQLNN